MFNKLLKLAKAYNDIAQYYKSLEGAGADYTDEEYEYLSKHAPDASRYFEILQNFGISVIPSKAKDSDAGLLGEGAYGKVYDAMYDGKRAAVKITYDKQDADAYKKIKEKRDQLPENIARHLPHVYAQFEDDTYTEGKTLYITVMEILRPISDELASLHFYADTDVYNQEVVEFVKNKSLSATIDNLEDIMRDICSKFGLDSSIIEKILNSAHLERFKEHLTKMKIGFATSAFLEALHNENIISDDISFDFEEYLGNSLRRYLAEPTEFPDFAEFKDYGKVFQSQKVQDLYDAVMYLYKEENISWYDVHAGNVMERPSDGSLVVADVGLFSFPLFSFLDKDN